MAASTNDLFKKTGASTVTTLQAPGKPLAATTITVGSTTNYPTDTGIVIAIRQVDTSGALVAGTYTEWSAIVTSSTTLTIVATPVMGNDQVYPAGSTTQVYIPLSAYNQQKLIEGLLASLNQDGSPKSGTTYTSPLFKGNVTGWTDPNESWAYSSYDATNKTGVITVPSDATTKYTLGMRVMFTNNSSVQYGLITAITTTTLTIYFGTNYSLTNSAITSPFYSVQKAPFGFPQDPAKWTQLTLYTGADPAKASPVSGTWYGDAALTNGGSLNLSVPIGAWRLSYSAIMAFAANTTALNATSQFSTLSTTTSTEVDQAWTIQARLPTSSTASNRFLAYRERLVILTTATPYYLLCQTADPNIGTIGFRTTAQGFSEIKATSAYL